MHGICKASALRNQGNAPFLVDCILEACLRKAGDGLFRVVHAHADAGAVEAVNLPLLLGAAIFGSEGHGQPALARYAHVCGTVLVAKGVPGTCTQLMPDAG